MIHEILLSLSGHPSPLLNNDYSSSSSILSPPEKTLLASIAHLSDLHCKLLTHTSAIRATHDSSICQAVATAIRSKHLSRFQRKILEVEDSLLRNDVGNTEEYSIIPMTALVEKFSGWRRVMEWLLQVIEYINQGDHTSKPKCSGAMIIDYLCEAIQTGYVDIEEVALSLITAAETAWLKQISTWVLYGRLPSFGIEDFFIQIVGIDKKDFESKKELLPAFVSDMTAESILFIGRSLNHIRAKRSFGAKSPELDLLPAHLQQIANLQFPISCANFSRVISSIKLSLAQNTLRDLLPTTTVNRILLLLREIFLLGRGEFAVALVTEADERIRSRSYQYQYLGYEKRDGKPNIMLKEGEISAVLSRTWTVLSALQGRQEDSLEDDEIIELARDLVYLTISRSDSTGNHHFDIKFTEVYSEISSTPFKNLLLSVPALLKMHVPSPIDLFLTTADVQIYSYINVYLLSIRRAHLRLTDLWKVTAIRRHHPVSNAIKNWNLTASDCTVRVRRKKIDDRFSAMRSVWATSSAALFFLAETEAYFQGEVIQSSWTGFKNWINSEAESPTLKSFPCPKNNVEMHVLPDLSSQASAMETASLHSDCRQSHDPQSLAQAHQKYLFALTSSLLLNIPEFTRPLYHLLQQIDHLVALVHRIHFIWKSLDLEAEEGILNAFSNFHKEEIDVQVELCLVADKVKTAIETLVNGLREIDQNKAGLDNGFTELILEEEGKYIPAKVGRINQLLIKLDFGGWFDSKKKYHQDNNFSSYERDS
ncbi:putative spc97 spc98 family protein [Golovinomyces cichoracearum]|uniref:Spindle pole body component n=1 Tax=Golovinomyces cichoracearum TaxID=62708 RepID=A0A420J9S2_9PEZI|nr:putative spc97 spc98 family protein [Golovinomyces cichoracearum]